MLLLKGDIWPKQYSSVGLIVYIQPPTNWLFELIILTYGTITFYVVSNPKNGDFIISFAGNSTIIGKKLTLSSNSAECCFVVETAKLLKLNICKILCHPSFAFHALDEELVKLFNKIPL